jgi:transcriptional regulator with XRE-family HTH domain
MAKTERRQLTQQEQRRAATFKRAWESKKSAEKISQAVAGEALDMSPSAFGQYINGKVPIGLEAAISLCHYLGVSHEEAEIAKELKGIFGSSADRELAALDELTELAPLLTSEEQDLVLAEFLRRLPARRRVQIALAALRDLPEDL